MIKPIKIVKEDKYNRRVKLRNFISSRAFESFIMTCIILNTIVLTITWVDQP
jgi:hypothetical protein